jgi:hypothetical protein
VHFSENWGFLSLSPIVGANLFSIAFGRNLDAHERDESSVDAAVARVAAHQCLEGRSCYVATLGLTGTACFATIFLSALAAWRERQKLMVARLRIVWEDTEN